MTAIYKTFGGAVLSGALLLASVPANGQGTVEVYTATAAVKTAAGAAATAPVTITIDRKMSQAEADKLGAAFRAGGAAALRKALVGVPPTGTIRLGASNPTPTRVTIERVTDKGRLLTILTDQALFFIGAGLPGSKPQTGFDFAVVDLEVDAKGVGSGNLAPAAKLKMNENAFVVEDYGAEAVRLTSVTKAK